MLAKFSSEAIKDFENDGGFWGFFYKSGRANNFIFTIDFLPEKDGLYGWMPDEIVKEYSKNLTGFWFKIYANDLDFIDIDGYLKKTEF